NRIGMRASFPCRQAGWANESTSRMPIHPHSTKNSIFITMNVHVRGSMSWAPNPSFWAKPLLPVLSLVHPWQARMPPPPVILLLRNVTFGADKEQSHLAYERSQ